MYEFETFAYLPLQKTGSTFIVDFFKRFSRERAVPARKHEPLQIEQYDPQKLYLISVRNPLDQYISLYSFGVGGGGGLYRRMRRSGYDTLYDGTAEGFRLWLKFVLRPSSAALLDSEYAKVGDEGIAGLVGYQSYRYLRLAIPSADKALEGCGSEDELRGRFQQRNIVGFVLRNESLNSDLATLVKTRLRDSITDVDGAVRYLEDAGRRNVSKRIDQYGEAIQLGEKLKKRLQGREWLLRELFGY
jgi:hypothetical protein